MGITYAIFLLKMSDPNIIMRKHLRKPKQKILYVQACFVFFFSHKRQRQRTIPDKDYWRDLSQLDPESGKEKSHKNYKGHHHQPPKQEQGPYIR